MKKRVYLIPGFMCNEGIWLKLIPLLKDKYELVHLQIPLKNSFDEICKELNTKIKDKKANIIGFSLGAYIAAYYNLKYENKIEKLMLISSSTTSLSKNEIEKREMGLEFIKRFGFNKLSKKAIISMLDEKNKQDEELISLIQNMYISLGEEVFFTQMNTTLYREDLTNDLLKLNTPIYFFYSKKDKLLDIQNLEYLEKYSNNFCFSKLDSTSHMLTLEKEFEVSSAIKDWF